MKKKSAIIISLFISCMLFTGCTNYVKTSDNKIVKNEKTGQNLVQNILCQPEAKSTLSAYKDNKINVKKLPKCSELKITSGKYEGIWTTIFVKPLAWLIMLFTNLVKNSGLAIILVTLLIRLLIATL